MPQQVPPNVKADRAGRLTKLATRLRDRYHERLIGMPLQVLVQAPFPTRPGVMSGTACRFAAVKLPIGRESEGGLVDAVAVGRHGDYLGVKLLSEASHVA